MVAGAARDYGAGEHGRLVSAERTDPSVLCLEVFIMEENDALKKSKATKKFYIVIALACGFGVYCGNMMEIPYGLTYMQASALAGASIFPAIVAGLVGSSLYRIFRKFPFIALVLAMGLGAATYATIGSFLVQPVKGNEANFILYGEHLKSFSTGLFGGIGSGILLAFFIKKRIIYRVDKIVNSMLSKKHNL
jgi:hypothetical protein